MRCRLAMIGLIVLAPVTALAGWWLIPENRVTSENHERIRKGITLTQVEEILGGPGVAISLWDQTGDSDAPGYSGIRMWSAGGCTILVVIEGDHVVDSTVDSPTLWERASDWYHQRDRNPGVRAMIESTHSFSK